MSAPEAESDIKPIIRPLTPTGVVPHSKDDKTSLAAKLEDLQNDKDAALSTSLSPENHSPPSPLMEIIPPPLSHRLQVTNPLESATAAVASSNTNTTSTQELQSLSELQHSEHTPCRLHPSWHFSAQTSDLMPWSILVTESQIDDAKNLVLDLLGWGVYLVTCGIHPDLIYRIFTDLNLRLPTNLVLSEDTIIRSVKL